MSGYTLFITIIEVAKLLTQGLIFVALVALVVTLILTRKGTDMPKGKGYKKIKKRKKSSK